MEAGVSEPLPEHISLSVEGALMEGLRILDEVTRIGLPPMRSRITLPVPLQPLLRNLSPEELDVLQVAMSQTQLEAVFNNCALDDLNVASALSTLISGNYLVVTPEVTTHTIA